MAVERGGPDRRIHANCPTQQIDSPATSALRIAASRSFHGQPSLAQTFGVDFDAFGRKERREISPKARHSEAGLKFEYSRQGLMPVRRFPEEATSRYLDAKCDKKCPFLSQRAVRPVDGLFVSTSTNAAIARPPKK